MKFRIKATLAFEEVLDEAGVDTVQAMKAKLMDEYNAAVALGEVPAGAFSIVECVRLFEEEIVDGAGARATA